jgi:hypothetical protein
MCNDFFCIKDFPIDIMFLCPPWVKRIYHLLDIYDILQIIYFNLIKPIFFILKKKHIKGGVDYNKKYKYDLIEDMKIIDFK